MAECQYNPDSGHNPHPYVSMTSVHIPVHDRDLSVTGLLAGVALALAGHTMAVATKAASFINVTPNN